MLDEKELKNELKERVINHFFNDDAIEKDINPQVFKYLKENYNKFNNEGFDEEKINDEEYIDEF